MVITKGVKSVILHKYACVMSYFCLQVIGTQIFFVGPWYIAVVDNVHWKFMQKARMTPRIINKDIPDPRMVGGIPRKRLLISRLQKI